MDLTNYELLESDAGELLETCLSEMAENCKGCKKYNNFSLENATDEEVARWCALIFSQWIIGKFEEEKNIKVNREKSVAIKKYIKARVPDIMAYIKTL